MDLEQSGIRDENFIGDKLFFMIVMNNRVVIYEILDQNVTISYQEFLKNKTWFY